MILDLDIKTGVARELEREECLKLCKSPGRIPSSPTKYQIWKSMRDEVILTLLYETGALVDELLKVRIRDINFNRSAIYIKDLKSKAFSRSTVRKGTHVETAHPRRRAFFKNSTRTLILRYLAGRKGGHLIVNSRGRKLSRREVERILDFYARAIDIQRLIGCTKNHKEIRLVTCKSLREAGKRHEAINRVGSRTNRAEGGIFEKGQSQGKI